MSLLLGIDSGLTVTKVVVFDEDGREVGQAAARVTQRTPSPGHVERDVSELYDATGQAIKEALSGLDATSVRGVGVTGHGDGLYLVDEDARPVRPAVLSLDSRAHRIVARWESDGTLERVFAATGRIPYVCSPAPLLAWVGANEPATLERAAWALSCKDTIKLWLTGVAGTDPTEASTSEAFESYGLAGVRHLVAPVAGATEISGGVTPSAAAATGLVPGTPVVGGMHDVDACAIGTGCLDPGDLSLIAGTFSINQVISDRPIAGRRWNSRRFVIPGRWINQAVSPASATNLEWFVGRFGSAGAAAARADGTDVFDVLAADIERLEGDGGPLFLPFLFGSPLGPTPSGGFLGLRGWHGRAHLARAVLEGVVFNHRWHVDDLLRVFPAATTRLAGGATRSTLWSQMFADGLNRRVEVAAAQETGALGVAMAAGVGTGVYADLPEAVSRTVRIARTHVPDPERAAVLDRSYTRFRQVVAALEPVFDLLETPLEGVRE